MTTRVPRPRKLMRTALFAVGKRVPFVLQRTRALLAKRRLARYRQLARESGVHPGVAVFESFRGRGYTCSPRAISEALASRPDTAGYEQIWVFTRSLAAAFKQRGYDVSGLSDEAVDDAVDLDASFGADALEQLRNVRIVVKNSRDYDAAFARAAVWVVNSRLPDYMTPREGQTLVQTWHGTPLKRLGLDIDTETWANPIYSRDEWYAIYKAEGERMTYLLAASPFAARALASSFGIPAAEQAEKVLQLGYPRNDRLSTFTAEQADAIKRRLGVPEGNRVILYAPTWRDDQHSSHTGYTFESPIDFDLFREQLGDGVTILFRAHYLVASSFDFAHYGDFVIDASSVNDINDLYIIADMLVTDYSSVFFDYANLRRPMAFFMYDLDAYANDIHGFYLDLEEMPGPIVRTQAELVEAIARATQPTPADVEQLDCFVATYAPNDDGHASDRVIERTIPPLV